MAGSAAAWRGSTGSLWQRHSKQNPEEHPLEQRPVSATPPDTTDTPRSRRKRGGLRKRFLSLTEGLATFISGSDKKAASNSLKNINAVPSPKKLRKSIFYVDHKDDTSGGVNFSNDMTVHEVFMNYNDTLSREAVEGNPGKVIGTQGSKIHNSKYLGNLSTRPTVTTNPRLVRSMSQGNESSGGVRAVKAPPSPPPRRYTLWGISSMTPKHLDNSGHQSPNMKPNSRAPPSPSRQSRYFPYVSGASSVILTPPSSPMTCRSYQLPLSKTSHSSTSTALDQNSQYYRSSSTRNTTRSPIFRFSKFQEREQDRVNESCSSSPRSPLVHKRRKAFDTFEEDEEEERLEEHTYTSIYSNRDNRLCSSGSGSCSRQSSSERVPAHKTFRRGSQGVPRVSRSPSQDRKSLLFGLGAYRGDWYRRKAARARRSRQSSIGPEGVKLQRVTVMVSKEGDSLGMTVRGGRCASDPDKSRPLVITHVRCAGPVDREGSIKAGDRLVAVDGHSVVDRTMTEAQDILRRSGASVTLTVEYDVSILSGVRQRGGALLVEVERPSATDLGLTLALSAAGDRIVIASIRRASIAERCGALAVGDRVTRIDGTVLAQLTAAEAMQLLRSSNAATLALEIVPVQHCTADILHHLQQEGGDRTCSMVPTCSTPGLPSCSSSSASYFSPSNSCNSATFNGSTCNGDISAGSTTIYSPAAAYGHCTGGIQRGCSYSTSSPLRSTVNHQITPPSIHRPWVDVITITLHEAHRGGYGLVLRPSTDTTVDPESAHPVVGGIDPSSPADRCGVLCQGDRLLAVNGHSTSGLGPTEAMQLVATSRNDVTLTIELDVPQSQVTGPVTADVNLRESPVGLGITLADCLSEIPLKLDTSKSHSPKHPTKGYVITSVVRGSPAHRSGLINAGDVLLAVDTVPVAGVPRLDTTIKRSNSNEREVSFPESKEGGSDEKSANENSTENIVSSSVDESNNNKLVQQSKVFSAFEVMQNLRSKAGKRTHLLLYKDDTLIDCSSSVQYTVEVCRDGRPLGLTLSGSEDPLSVLCVAALTPGGLAERTGAIHVGDRLLAINGHSLKGQPLSRAVELLQSASATVTLKIARPRVTSDERQGTDPPQPPEEVTQHRTAEWVGGASIDSAVESWGGSSSGGGVSSPPSSPPPVRGTPPRSDINGNRRSPSIRSITRPALSPSPTAPMKVQDCSNRTVNSTNRTVTSTNRTVNSSPVNSGPVIRLPSTSPPPTPDSGQSGLDGDGAPDWDEMIAALNTISESCGLTVAENSSANKIRDEGPNRSEGEGRRAGESGGEEETEELEEEGGVYSVSAAEMMSRSDFSAKTIAEAAEEVPRTKMFRVMLSKDPVYEDFGFSVSDGLYEKGVYVNRIRQGGPADRCGKIQPYDRILQVNDTHCHEFDCCLAVPLMASAGNTLTLLLSRNLNEASVPLLRRTPDCLTPPHTHEGLTSNLQQLNEAELMASSLYCTSTPDTFMKPESNRNGTVFDKSYVASSSTYRQAAEHNPYKDPIYSSRLEYYPNNSNSSSPTPVNSNGSLNYDQYPHNTSSFKNNLQFHKIQIHQQQNAQPIKQSKQQQQQQGRPLKTFAVPSASYQLAGKESPLSGDQNKANERDNRSDDGPNLGHNFPKGNSSISCGNNDKSNSDNGRPPVTPQLVRSPSRGKAANGNHQSSASTSSISFLSDSNSSPLSSSSVSCKSSPLTSSSSAVSSYRSPKSLMTGGQDLLTNDTTDDITGNNNYTQPAPPTASSNSPSYASSGNNSYVANEDAYQTSGVPRGGFRHHTDSCNASSHNSFRFAEAYSVDGRMPSDIRAAEANGYHRTEPTSLTIL